MCSALWRRVAKLDTPAIKGAVSVVILYVSDAVMCVDLIVVVCCLCASLSE